MANTTICSMSLCYNYHKVGASKEYHKGPEVSKYTKEQSKEP